MTRFVALKPEVVPYSSVVGSSISLLDDKGRARFMIMFCGTTEGIEREESEALRDRISALITEHGLSVPARQVAP